MRIPLTKIKKRLPITAAIMVCGVAAAGLLASLIETPQGETEYLHDHLIVPEASMEVQWESAEFELLDQDKAKIADVITQSDRPNWSQGNKITLVGQALKAAQEASCAPAKPVCTFPLRLDRKLNPVHVNKDYRVVNIEETSSRVDVEINSDTNAVLIKGITQEVRLLRFYLTQIGWMQNLAQSVEIKPQSLPSRKGKFDDKFSKHYVGLNYYPASASWQTFWTDFPVEQIESDLDKALSLNVNSVRIFLQHDYFDDPDTREDGLSKLTLFLDMCESREIQVLVTLFDLRPNYTLLNWAADIDHIDRVLPAFVDHKAVLGIDIKNQANLDFEHWGVGIVEAWLSAMMNHIQSRYPDTALTVGWSEGEHATRLHDVVDFVSYHEYRDPEGFDTRLRDITASVDGKPVMITELGSSVWRPPFTAALAEAKQADLLENQLGQAGQANGVFLWTLNDFDHVGREVVGPLPWRQAQQRHFGVLRPDGSERPAAAVLKAFGERPQIRRSKSSPLYLLSNLTLTSRRQP